MKQGGEEYKQTEYLKKTKHTDNKTNKIFSSDIDIDSPISLSKEHLQSCSILSYRCYCQSKNFKVSTIANTNINDEKSCKVGTVEESRLPALDSLKHCSMAE